MDNPAQLGERLLPQVVDQYALHCPDRIFGSYPNSNGTSLVYHEVTMGQLASAVNFLAWWIKRKIGTSFDFETVSFIGISDFRYSMFCLAGIKCGFKVSRKPSGNLCANRLGLTSRDSQFSSSDQELVAPYCLQEDDLLSGDGCRCREA